MAALACQPGTILVEAGAILPAGVLLQPGALSQDWRSLADLDRIGLASAVAKAGWTFFYMAGVVAKHAFGWSQEKRVRAALGRVVQDVQAQNCNCVEITRLRDKSFLGLPYVKITAHARHIQAGSQFRDPPERSPHAI
ncbi:MAG: hypothetical protein ACLQU1_43560 [Bryobacteraceae bacterium]